VGIGEGVKALDCAKGRVSEGVVGAKIEEKERSWARFYS
jgi:hypothetical protein